jgi:acyl-coenzyme A synthetase/AMP-(fatty) acid ligase
LEQFYKLLELKAAISFDDPFLVTPEQVLSFGEVQVLSKKIVQNFRELGIKSGDIVGLDLPVAIGVLFSVAALHEGVVAYSGAGRTKALEGQTKHVFSSNPDLSSDHFTSSLVDSAYFEAIDGYSTDVEPVGFESNDALCRLVFSSGTTGDPKPISLTVSMVENRSLAAGKLRNGQDAFLCILNPSSSSGFHTLISSLQDGLPFLVPGNAQENLKLIHKHSVSAIKASPFQIRELLDFGEKLGYKLESLKNIYSAGASVPIDLVKRVEAKRNITLHNLFGSSEAGRGAERILNSADMTWVGQVVDGTEMQIVDEDHSHVPLGSIGSVRYRRDFQALEYFGEPELTGKVFHDGWFYTGDLGRLNADGRLYLEGRTSRIMNIAGVKINPEAVIQDILARPGVLDAVAFEHRPADGQNEFGVGMQVVENYDFEALARELKISFGSSTPQILFNLPELPRNAAGKPISAAVAELYLRAIQGA